jgi:phospholipase C
MRLRLIGWLIIAASALAVVSAQSQTPLSSIETVVVIYAENRSFDNLYGTFPGASGLDDASRNAARQLDRDGTVMRELPPIWGGLTLRGMQPPVTLQMTAHLANKPFAIDNPTGFNVPTSATTRDLVHRFYQNQMQIDGGKNDKFAAYTDSGALTMGHYDGSTLEMWKVAKRYTLADHFFMGAFGGSFLNHIYLVCACVPRYPNADKSAASDQVSVVEPNGVALTPAPDMPKSAVTGPPKFVQDGNLTPDFYAVNTMQPPYQPSANPPAPGGDPRFADLGRATTLVPQTVPTIGDRLTAKGVTWAWYGGGWEAALTGDTVSTKFQFHHQPFNYFAAYAPGTPERSAHLRDAGVDGDTFIRVVDGGKLPQVAFYKPSGTLNQHAGYTDVQSGDKHIADVIAHLEKSPQWAHMLVVVTYDENGGFWDHMPVPKADRWGPGSRIPAIIVSPMAKKGFVDHTPYDTASILRFLTKRFGLETLDGVAMRDKGAAANGNGFGDLTNALTVR